MCSLLGLCKTLTTLLHPQSDGLVERFNCTLTTQLAILTSETSVTDRHVSLVLWVWAYQTAVQEYTGCMAAALMFGQEPQTPVELVSAPHLNQRSPGGPGFEYLQKLQNRLHILHERARDLQGAATARQKCAYDIHSNDRDIAPGTEFGFTPLKGKKGYSLKLYCHWHGLCDVLAKISDVMYLKSRWGRWAWCTLAIDLLCIRPGAWNVWKRIQRRRHRRQSDEWGRKYVMNIIPLGKLIPFIIKLLLN